MAKNKEIFRTKSSRLLNQIAAGTDGIVSITINAGVEGSVLRNLRCQAASDSTTNPEITISINGNGSYGSQTNVELLPTSTFAANEIFDLMEYLPFILSENGEKYVPIESGESITVSVDFNSTNKPVIAGVIEDY